MANMDVLKMFARLCVVGVLVCLAAPTPATAGWLIFNKPAYEGQIVDIDTKEPIEGAVVVAIYNTEVLGIGDTISNVVNVKETMTDKDGMFRIPSYTTMIIPNSWEDRTTFIVYKPGYVSVDELDLEECLSSKCTSGEMKWISNQQKKWRLSSGLIELEKVVNGKDRLRALPSLLDVFDREKMPYFYQTVNKEHKYLGLDEI